MLDITFLMFLTYFYLHLLGALLLELFNPLPSVNMPLNVSPVFPNIPVATPDPVRPWPTAIFNPPG